MPGHSHDILHDELQGFDVFRYTDINFVFSGDATRQITFRLVFAKMGNMGTNFMSYTVKSLQHS